jgi:hypothetical protein
MTPASPHNSLDRILQNLSVLSRLDQNDKLMTEGEAFAIYTPTIWRGSYRYWVRESRDTNLVRVCQCIRDAQTFVTQILSEHHYNESDEMGVVASHSISLQIQTRTQTQQCARVLQGLTDAIKGLENLQTTYRDDAATLCRIKNTINEITDFVGSTELVVRKAHAFNRIETRDDT